jgi:hypothetical protein
VVPQTARIVRGEADRTPRILGDPDAARRRFTGPRAAELGVDPAENPFGRAMLA